jgi:hypothetical protein
MRPGGLGVLSLHLDPGPCPVACPFCYLGARAEEPLLPLSRLAARPRQAGAPAHAHDELLRAAERLDYAELAIAVSEPIAPVAPIIARLIAAARHRGRPVAVTTTPQVVAAHPTVLDGVTRLNLSVDPWKLDGGAEALLAEVDAAAAAAHARDAQVVAIATLSTPGFAAALVDGLLEALVARPHVDGVALNALKPPPPFCDRAFWLDMLSRLRPLLARELDRRLFLDCYVAARLLGIGGCPARPDLTPAPDGAIAFRTCVYAARADAVVGALAELGPVLEGFEAPRACPFDTRL